MEFEYNELNDDWINNFESNDKIYQDFYKDDIYFINLKFIYINRSSDIDKIKQESFLLKIPNYVNREEIIGLLKKNSIDNEKRYTLLSILKYNITLDAEDIKIFLKNQNQPIDYKYLNSKNTSIFLDNDNFLTVIKNIDTIKFEKTINMFHDLNDLIFVFYEKSTELKEQNPNNITKKIYLRSSNYASHKKTIKKRYKD